jgi:copper chaperone CopZ
MAVTKALKCVAGVESVEVGLEQQKAVIAGSADVASLIQAIEKAGYRAELRA